MRHRFQIVPPMDREVFAPVVMVIQRMPAIVAELAHPQSVAAVVVALLAVGMGQVFPHGAVARVRRAAELAHPQSVAAV